MFLIYRREGCKVIELSAMVNAVTVRDISLGKKLQLSQRSTSCWGKLRRVRLTYLLIL